MARPNSIHATLSAKAVSQYAFEIALDLARADEDQTGTWADSARRNLALAEAEIVRLKTELAELPTSRRAA